jgi:FkbM family methyltransferase
MLRSFARQLTPPAIARAAANFVRRVSTPDSYAQERELQRLRALPESQSSTTDIFGWPFHILDGKSFAHLYELHFRRQVLRFKAAGDMPRVIDCGANVGVTVVWWKTQFPQARVLAFEADPEIFTLLQRNCGHLPGVELINAAVWDRQGELPFAAKGGEGGHMAEFAQTHPELIRNIPCVRLRSYLDKRCDFLKLDIEGAEIAVIRDCADVLRNVAKAFVEYHSFVGRDQLLGQTVSILENAGFRLHVHTELPSARPFEELFILNAKDLRLDLFCFREETSARPSTSNQADGNL